MHTMFTVVILVGVAATSHNSPSLIAKIIVASTAMMMIEIMPSNISPLVKQNLAMHITTTP
jgi:hypothetical protein